MKKLITIGELLIDFIPSKKGISLKKTESFTKMPGGAPANVAATVSKLGGNSVMLTKLGSDGFGDFLIDTLNEVNVNTDYIKRTSDANTALAFVSLDQKGNREFAFYRNPSADLLFNKNEIPHEIFSSHDILHFCSVDLIESPMKKAHLHAIKYALKNNMIVSFDPNIRLNLWKDHTLYRKVINKFIPLSHLLKISDDELEFITGTSNTDAAINSLFIGNIKVIILTKGENGATVYTRTNSFSAHAFPAHVVDTTGAGDAFIGAVIFDLLRNFTTLQNLDKNLNYNTLMFANAVSKFVVENFGAISSIPNLDQVLDYINSMSNSHE